MFLFRHQVNIGGSRTALKKVTKEVQAKFDNIFHEIMFFQLLYRIHVFTFLNCFPLPYHTQLVSPPECKRMNYKCELLLVSRRSLTPNP